MASHISPSKMETKASSSTAQDFIDYGDVCRICGSDENSLNLIGIYSNEGLGDDLPTKINTYLPVTVASTDDLPLQCCTKCVSTLNSWHVFVNNSVEADSKWKNFHVLASSSNKLLNEEEGDDGIGDRDDDQSELDDDMPLSELVETKQEPEDDDDDYKMPWKQIFKTEVKDVLPIANEETCKTCGLKLKSSFALNRHMFAEHGEWNIAPYSAPSSGDNVNKIKSVTSSTGRNKFAIRHGKLTKCPHCEYVAFHSLVEQHMDSHSVEKRCKCKICGKAFHRPHSVRIHKRSHFPSVDVHECHICQKRLASAHGLQQHMKLHSEKDSHFCDECGKGFKVRDQLKDHKLRTHGTKLEKVYGRHEKCPHCDFVSRKSLMELHMITHSTEKSFLCKTCGKGYRWANSLKEHELSHSTTSPRHCCSFCGKAFNCKSNLKRHEMDFHTAPATEKKFECYICHKMFAYKRYLNNHLLITHKKRVGDVPSSSA